MRKRKQDGKLTLQAVAGTNVVLLGWSMTKQDSRHILGFAVHRQDHTDDESYWLEGIKVFEVTRDKKIVWTYDGPFRAHEIQVLTTNGQKLVGLPLK
jgi:hypothetical protein